ncbi:MAG: hypothetical protein U5K54_10785 [Cytophagales bacterium]|nr:hypothetical protein [Cytophagales bacterium]
MEIEFCLSPVDQNGNVLAQPGIHRYNGSKAFWTRNEIENRLKPTTIWNPNIFTMYGHLKNSEADANFTRLRANFLINQVCLEHCREVA